MRECLKHGDSYETVDPPKDAPAPGSVDDSLATPKLQPSPEPTPSWSTEATRHSLRSWRAKEILLEAPRDSTQLQTGRKRPRSVRPPKRAWRLPTHRVEPGLSCPA